MQVDWRQILTHIVGFLVAVFVLKRYAWGPILKLLEERREKIRGEFDRIDKEKKGAAALKAEYEGQLRGIDAQARAKVQEAVHDGQKVAAEIREQARRDAHDQLTRAREEMVRDQDKASAALRNEMAEMVVRATEMLVRERLDQEKQLALVRDFIASIDTLESPGGAP